MAAKNRISRNAPVVDLSALKYIRIVLATYILGVGLGITDGGFDANTYFSGFLTHPTSVYVSTLFVTFCALMLFFGYMVRFVSLSLAIVILASSIQTNWILDAQGSNEAFLTDLVLVCALMANYCTLSPRQLRKQALISSSPAMKPVDSAATGRVVPRRVSGTSSTPDTAPRLSFETSPAAAHSADPKTQGAVATQRVRPSRPSREEPEDDVINIFA